MKESLLAKLAIKLYLSDNNDESEEARTVDIETRQTLQEIRANISYLDNRLLEGDVDTARKVVMNALSDNIGKIERALGHK